MDKKVIKTKYVQINEQFAIELGKRTGKDAIVYLKEINKSDNQPNYHWINKNKLRMIKKLFQQVRPK